MCMSMAHKHPTRGEKYQVNPDSDNQMHPIYENVDETVIFGEEFCQIVGKAKCTPPAIIAVNRIDENFYMKHIEDFKKQLQKSVESTGAWLLVDDKTLPFILKVFGKMTSDRQSNTEPKEIRADRLRKDIFVISSADQIVQELEITVAEKMYRLHGQEQNIPVIKVVIGGEMDQIRLFKETLYNGAGWVVVRGSGLAADYISECKILESLSDQGVNTKEFMKNKLDKYLKSSGVQKTLFDTVPNLGNKGNKIYVHSFGQEDETRFEQNIQNFMFDAVKDRSTLQHQVHLVSKWNRIDIFEDEVFAVCLKNRRDDNIKKTLLCLFESSFAKGNTEFVDVLVDFLAKEISDQYINLDDMTIINLEREMEMRNTSDKMEHLYNNCLNLDTKGNVGKIIWAMIKNLNSLQKIKSQRNKDAPKKITLAEIQRIIHKFCGDDKLNIYGKIKTSSVNIQDSKKSQADQEEEVMFRLFVCCILTNRMDIALIFWKRCKNNIFAALFASNILKKMAHQASRQHFLELHQSCSENASFFEDLSTKVMTEFFEYKSDAAMKFLVTKVKRYNATPLEFANRCRLMRFIAATPCQVKLETIWMGDIEPQTSPLKVFIGILFPFLIICNVIKVQLAKKSNNDDADEMNEDNSTKCTLGIWNFYRAPISTFFIHMILYLAFITNFALFVLSDLYPVSEKRPSFKEVVTWALVLSLIIEEICQVFINKEMSLKYKIKNWVHDLWNVFDLITFLVFAVAFTLRYFLEHEHFYNARFAYSISLGLFILRTLQFFYISRRIGPKVVMLEKLMADVIFFISLFAVFVFTFGIMYQVELFPNTEPSWELFKDIVFLPYMQLFGELNIDIVKGSEPRFCTDDEWNDHLPRCPQSSANNIIILAVYLIFTYILLLNTLIAMFSFTIQKVHENSETIWKYNRYTVIREYYERRTFPVPLIAHIWRLITCCSCCKKNKFSLEANDEYDVLERKAVENYLLDPTKADRKVLQNQMKEHDKMLVDKILDCIKSQRSVAPVRSDGLGSSTYANTVVRAPRPDHDQGSSA